MLSIGVKLAIALVTVRGDVFHFLSNDHILTKRSGCCCLGCCKWKLCADHRKHIHRLSCTVRDSEEASRPVVKRTYGPPVQKRRRPDESNQGPHYTTHPHPAPSHRYARYTAPHHYQPGSRYTCMIHACMASALGFETTFELEQHVVASHHTCSVDRCPRYFATYPEAYEHFLIHSNVVSRR